MCSTVTISEILSDQASHLTTEYILCKQFACVCLVLEIFMVRLGNLVIFLKGKQPLFGRSFKANKITKICYN